MKLEFESNTSTMPHFGNGHAANADSETQTLLIPQILKAGIKAAQTGERNEARQLLIQVTEAEPDNETAWLWMASISEYPEELIIFLNNVLSINPNNARALEWMKATKVLLASTFVQRGVDASNDANMDFARQCFLQAIVHDAENETAWFWLASISDAADEKIAHLQKVLNINPTNETAKTSLETAKKQVAESVLRKANSAAVAGERESARAMLQEVFQYAPEMEGAWILKSYLADTFSEKITCFEKVLTLNPENEMAISGINSLRAMMAKTEAKKAEQAARIAEMESAIAAEQVLVVSQAQIISSENEEIIPTQELEFPPAFADSEQDIEISENKPLNARFQPADVPAFNQTQESYRDLLQEESNITTPPDFKENFAGNEVSAENKFMNHNQFNNQSSVSNESAQTEFAHNYDETPTDPFASTFSESRTVFSPAAGEAAEGESSAKSSACPFCNNENDPNAFVCGSCRTILTLSDLEMLLAHTEADRETLSGAIEQMESERNSRTFSADELKNLAIGHINLKNLRHGVAYLQKAAQMNPNDVMLGSKSIPENSSVGNRTAGKQSQRDVERQKNFDCGRQRDRSQIDFEQIRKKRTRSFSAVDGIDALEKIKEFMPDLILLDIMMPQLDGYQVCKLIRTNELTKDVPIVMISGKDGFFDKVRGRMAGTTGYITKPFRTGNFDENRRNLYRPARRDNVRRKRNRNVI